MLVAFASERIELVEFNVAICVFLTYDCLCKRFYQFPVRTLCKRANGFSNDNPRSNMLAVKVRAATIMESNGHGDCKRLKAMSLTKRFSSSATA